MPAKTILKKTNTKIYTIDKENIDVLLNARFEFDDYISEEEFEEKPKKVTKVKKYSDTESDEDEDNVYDEEKIILLQNENKKIKYVVHMADIHIKKRDREDEFRIVFNNLLKNLKEKKLNDKNSVIVIAGDVMDNGIDLHPRSVKLTKDFIILIAEITDVVIISGNHDLSPQNDKDNGLHSVLFATQTKHNVYFLENQGLYEYNNILFGHTKFGENQSVQPCKLKMDKIKCGLYHGTLSGSKTESGIIFENTKKEKKYLTVGDFKDYQYVFLGDIHKHLFLTEKIAYPGSLIQMDQTESLIKGYILWNFEKSKGEFIRIKSDYGKIKININEKGKPDIDIKTLPKYIEVDVDCKSMNRKHIDDLYSKITLENITISKKNDRMKYDENTFDTKIEIKGKKQDMVLLKNNDDVIKLLLSCSNKILDKKLSEELTNILNEKLKEYEFLSVSNKKNIKLISLKFSNMSIYGANNIIDFTKLNGIVGIPGNNSLGKSSLIDIILYSIFGVTTRGSSDDLINVNEKELTCEIVLDVNNVIYTILRKNNKNTSEKLFIYKNGECITTKGLSNNRNIITEHIGYVDDFLNTCIVTQKAMFQGKSMGFAELTGKERRNMLCKISRLDVYDYLSTELSKNLTTIQQNIGKNKTQLKVYDEFGDNYENIEKNIIKKVIELEQKIINLTNLDNEYKNKKDELKKNISRYEVELEQINKKIVEITKDNKNIENYDDSNIDELINETEKYISNNIFKLQNKNNKKINLENKLKSMGDVKNIEEEFKLTNKKKIMELKEKINCKRNNMILDFDYSNYKKINTDKEIKNINAKIKKNEIKLTEINDQIKKNNEIVNEKIKIVLKEDFDNFNSKTEEFNKIKSELTDLNKRIKEYNKKYDMLKNHEYDKNCVYCMKNTITQEKRYVEEMINDLKEKKNNLNKKHKTLDNFIDENKFISDEYFKYLEQTDKQQNAKNLLLILNKDLQLCNHELDDFNRKKNEYVDITNNYQKYLNNKKIEQEITEIECEIDKINDSVNEKMIIVNDSIQKINFICLEISKLETTNEKEKLKLIKLHDEKKTYEKNKETYLELNILKKNKKNTENKFSLDSDELKKLEKKIEGNLKDIKKIENGIFEIKNKKKLFEENKKKIKSLEKDKDNYTILVQLLKNNGGIIDTLFKKNLIPKFEKIVNDLLQQFGQNTIDITYEKNEIKMRDNRGIDIIRNGGYQSYLFNLIFRIAISQLNGYMSTDFMIIDEVCDSADFENKANIKKLIDFVKLKNKWTLIVSHDEDIKDKYEKIFRINKNNKIDKSHKLELL